jgi:hypothetical protein
MSCVLEAVTKVSVANPARIKGYAQAFAERLAAKGKAKKVIIGAVMRKLVHICYGVIKHRTPYDPAKAFDRTTPAM